MSEQTGGKLYAKAGYSCIFVPPLACKGDSQKVPLDEKVKDGTAINKLMLKDGAEDEYAVSKRVREIPLSANYFAVADSICTPNAIQAEKDLDKCDVLKGKKLGNDFRLLGMHYAGVPISDIKINVGKFSLKDLLVSLLEAGALLNLYGVVHRDMHQGNILINNAGSPRIIDFNLSIDVRKPVQMNELYHGHSIHYFQEPPDSTIVNAIVGKYDPYTVMDELIEKKDIIRRIQSVLGIQYESMRRDLTDFYKRSKSVQSGDMVEWFNNYWRKIDSWAIGVNIVYIIHFMSYNPKFLEGEKEEYRNKMLPVLRKLCEVSPIKRIDCVQALAYIDPGNHIIRGKKAVDWLKKVGSGF